MTGPGKLPGKDDPIPALRRRVWSTGLQLKRAKVHFLGLNSRLIFEDLIES